MDRRMLHRLPVLLVIVSLCRSTLFAVAQAGIDAHQEPVQSSTILDSTIKLPRTNASAHFWETALEFGTELDMSKGRGRPSQSFNHIKITDSDPLRAQSLENELQDELMKISARKSDIVGINGVRSSFWRKILRGFDVTGELNKRVDAVAKSNSFHVKQGIADSNDDGHVKFGSDDEVIKSMLHRPTTKVNVDSASHYSSNSIVSTTNALPANQTFDYHNSRSRIASTVNALPTNQTTSEYLSSSNVTSNNITKVQSKFVEPTDQLVRQTTSVSNLHRRRKPAIDDINTMSTAYPQLSTSPRTQTQTINFGTTPVIQRSSPTASSRHGPRKRRGSLDFLWFIKNTNYCGPYHRGNGELGSDTAADTCCKEHDECQTYVEAWEYKFSLFNARPHTICHCDCDDKFRTCLKNVGSAAAGQAGRWYFNILRAPCFKFVDSFECVRNFFGRLDCGNTRKTEVITQVRY